MNSRRGLLCSGVTIIITVPSIIIIPRRHTHHTVRSIKTPKPPLWSATTLRVVYGIVSPRRAAAHPSPVVQPTRSIATPRFAVVHLLHQAPRDKTLSPVNRGDPAERFSHTLTILCLQVYFLILFVIILILQVTMRLWTRIFPPSLFSINKCIIIIFYHRTHVSYCNNRPIFY